MGISQGTLSIHEAGSILLLHDWRGMQSIGTDVISAREHCNGGESLQCDGLVRLQEEHSSGNEHKSRKPRTAKRGLEPAQACHSELKEINGKRGQGQTRAPHRGDLTLSFLWPCCPPPHKKQAVARWFQPSSYRLGLI